METGFRLRYSVDFSCSQPS